MKLLIIGLILFLGAFIFAGRIELFFDYVIWMPLIAYAILRSYSLPNDEYTGKGVYILFKRPRTFIDVIHCLLFMPVSSVSVVVDNEWYGYTIFNPIKYELYKHDKSHRLLRVDLGQKRARMTLRRLIGTEWSFDYNCCHMVHDLFDYRFSWLDSIPSHLARTLKKM